MAHPVLEEARFPMRVSVSVAVQPGDLLAYDGSAWVLADADTPAKYARLISGDHADGFEAKTITGYKEAVIYDSDAPFTLDSPLYLSATAGDFTHTRPSTAGQIKQCVGQALSTERAHIRCGTLRQQMVDITVMYATSANAQLDSGNFGGPTLDAQNEVCSMIAVVPENAVSVAYACLYLAAEATAGTPTFDLSVGSAIDGAQHDAVTPDTTIANSALEGAAADEMQVTDITTALDATDIIRPGAILGLLATKDDGGTDVSIIFGGAIYFLVVD